MHKVCIPLFVYTEFLHDTISLPLIFSASYTEIWIVTKKIPTDDDILAMLAMSPDDLEKPDNLQWKNICLWYFDRYLPIPAKKDFFGEDIRYYNLYTDKMNVNGKQKVSVTVASEAFGLTVLKNCHEKWNNIFKLKEKDPKAKIPSKKEDKNYSDYAGEWTEPKSGKVPFGGWATGALEYFSEMEDKLIKLREDDAANDHKKAKYYKEIMRAAHGIDEPKPSAKKRRGKQILPSTQAPKEKKVRHREE